MDANAYQMEMAAMVAALGIADQPIRMQNREHVSIWTDCEGVYKGVEADR